VDGRPLAGRSVVVTRAPEQAATLVDALRGLGADVVELPLIAVVEPADGGAALAAVLDDLDHVDWLVVTSPNGAQRVAGALSSRPPGSPHVAAVGAATEAALGRRADIVPDEQIAEGLLDLFPTGEGRVVVAQAAESRGVLEPGLTERGWSVEIVATHRTAIAPADLIDGPVWRAACDRARDADAVVFTSGSAARGWAAAVGSHTPAIVVAIGPATAAVARQENLKITHVATDHSVGGVLAALVQAVADGQ
jgi:uroporphyrinogen-III synthase